MRRLSVLALLVVLLIGLAAAGPRATAQEASPVAGTTHPLVGTWLVDTDTEGDTDPPALFIFFADGAYLEYDAEEGGDVAAGRWQATGDQTADVTLVFVSVSDEAGYEGMGKIRASIEVAADGESFTADYSFEFIDPSGEGSGEYGPGTATGTRLEVEPMGELVGTAEELFELFEDASPEASPAP
jgi:hypothetical protein